MSTDKQQRHTTKYFGRDLTRTLVTSGRGAARTTIDTYAMPTISRKGTLNFNTLRDVPRVLYESYSSIPYQSQFFDRMIDAILLQTPQYRAVTTKLTSRSYAAMYNALRDAQIHNPQRTGAINTVGIHFLSADHVTSGAGCMLTLFPDVVRLLYWGMPTLHTRTAAGKILDALYSDKEFAALHAKTKHNLMASLAAAYELLMQQASNNVNTVADAIDQTAATEAAQQVQAQSQPQTPSQQSQQALPTQAQPRALSEDTMRVVQGVANYADSLQNKMAQAASDNAQTSRKCERLNSQLNAAQRNALSQQLASMDASDAASGDMSDGANVLGGSQQYDPATTPHTFDAVPQTPRPDADVKQSGAGTASSDVQMHSTSACMNTIKTFAKLSSVSTGRKFHGAEGAEKIVTVDAHGNPLTMYTHALANGQKFVDALDMDGSGAAFSARSYLSNDAYAIDATLTVMGALDAGYRAIEAETSFGNGAYADMTLGANIHKVPASMLHTVYAKEFQPMLYTRLAEGLLPNVQHISQTDKGHGPVIICADLSGSTSDTIRSMHAHETTEHNPINNVARVTLIKALALLFYRKLRQDGRTVILLPFTNQPLRYMEVIATDSPMLKQSLAERKRRLALFLSARPDGGTAFDHVLYRVIGLLSNFQEENILHGADVIYITDGECRSSSRKQALNTVQRVYAATRGNNLKAATDAFDHIAYRCAGVLPQFQKDIVFPDNTRIYGVMVAPESMEGFSQSSNYGKPRCNHVFPAVHWPVHDDNHSPCVFDCVTELGFTADSMFEGLRMLYEEILKRSVYDFEDTDSYVTL